MLIAMFCRFLTGGCPRGGGNWGTPECYTGLFGNLNLRFVGHAPEALDRVIIEGDVTRSQESGAEKWR